MCDEANMVNAAPSPAQAPLPRRRGRPRGFDVEVALEQARGLFLVHGYDPVTLADLTAAMGINPPSFYAAFGSKALLFARVAERHAQSWNEEIRACLSAPSALDAALEALMALAAARFAPGEGAQRGGCLILESAVNGSDPLVVALARRLRLGLATTIYRAAAAHAPERAALVTDWAMAMLAGLSAMAREGTDAARLRALAAHMPPPSA